MGDTMIQLEDSKLKIPRMSKFPALKAIKGLIGHTETVSDQSGKHWAWVYPNDVRNSNNLEQALLAWKWKATTDGVGNIVHLQYVGDKRGDEELLFHTIAPFIEGGSYLRFTINGTRILTYQFEGGRCSCSLI